MILFLPDGLYQQVEGLAMGSPPAPLLANGWMHQFDNVIKGDAVLYERYMDDILRDIDSQQVDEKLNEINNLHPALKFTIEREQNSSIPFLDMKIHHNQDGSLSSTWYSKKTDTGLIMNYHALAPDKYKRSVVSGMVHRIVRACSSWKFIHESLEKAKKILQNNQYPPWFYDPVIKDCLHSIIAGKENDNENGEPEEKKEGIMIMIQYRGKPTDKFEKSLKSINAPCKIVKTLRKLKTVLPSLKPSIEKSLKSGVVYQISCSRCNSRYVGQTARHLLTRIKEHSRVSSKVGSHFKECNCTLTLNDVKILGMCNSQKKLLILEALYIEQIKPDLNTKDEYKSHTLIVKF